MKLAFALLRQLLYFSRPMCLEEYLSYRLVKTDDGVIESEDVLHHMDDFDNDGNHDDQNLECEMVPCDASEEVNYSCCH